MCISISITLTHFTSKNYKICLSNISLFLIHYFWLQFHSMINNNISADTIGLTGNSKLLLNIRQTVTDLASSTKVINTIKLAAQKTLEIGWFILFQTPNERANMLYTILQPLTSPSGIYLLFIIKDYLHSKFLK